MATKAAVTITNYSGLPVGTQFQSPDGPRTEMQTAREFVDNVTLIGESAGWKDEVMRSNAQLALMIGTPAHNWNQLKGARLRTWKEFRSALVAKFHKPLNPTERVKLIRDTRQEKKEATDDYLTRLTLKFNRFNAVSYTHLTLPTICSV